MGIWNLIDMYQFESDEGGLHPVPFRCEPVCISTVGLANLYHNCINIKCTLVCTPGWTVCKMGGDLRNLIENM